MITQEDIKEFKDHLEEEGYVIDDKGYFECLGKWSGEHWSSKFLWDCHLDGWLSFDSWNHDGLGCWAMIKLDGEQLKALELEDDSSPWIEVHERDDGIMEINRWNDSLHEARVKELDELCHDPADEDEDDESKWDDDTHEIIVASQFRPRAHVDAFVKWLRVRGHDAKLGEGTRDYVDGEWVQNDDEANDIFESLWARFVDA